MKHDIINIDSKKVGTVELNKDIFFLPIRKDILKDVVNWQLANRRQGTHKVKQRSEIVGTTAKAFKQKGTGRARRGNLKTNILRGGGVTHGPVIREHKKKLPKNSVFLSSDGGGGGIYKCPGSIASTCIQHSRSSRLRNLE